MRATCKAASWEMVRRNTKALRVLWRNKQVTGDIGGMTFITQSCEAGDCGSKADPQKWAEWGQPHPEMSLCTFSVVRDLHMGTFLYQSLYGGGRGLWSLSGQAIGHGGGDGLCWSRGCWKDRSVWDATATTAFLASGWSFNNYRWTAAML